MRTSKILILLTAEFPYGFGETFLETEIHYLSREFERIIILTGTTPSQSARPIPTNCEVRFLSRQVSRLDKILSLFLFFHPLIWQELTIIRSKYRLKFSRGILATMLISLWQALKIKRKVLSLTQSLEKSFLVLYSYWCDEASLGIALINKKHRKLKAVCRMHGWDVFFERNKFHYLPFRHVISNSLDNVFSVSETALYYAKEIWKVDTTHFLLSRLGVNRQKDLQNSDNGIFTIISCSSLVPIKRVERIAKAIQIMDGKFPIQWVHIGDGPEKENIQSLIGNISTSTIIVFTGKISNAEVINTYREFRPHLFINVSESEGIPVSIMEAMSFGIPVIATDVGGNKEIVNDKNGWLVNKDISPESLAQLVISIRDSSAHLIKRQEAWNTWNNLYNAEKNYTSFCKLLSS